MNAFKRKMLKEALQRLAKLNELLKSEVLAREIK